MDNQFFSDPNGHPEINNSDFAGICINIRKRAKIRRSQTQCLVGGGSHSHDLGYAALRWEMILHGNAGYLGKYAVIAFLPDKIACFIYEYHDTSYASLGLPESPSLPQDRSRIDVYRILQPQQVGHYIIYMHYMHWLTYKSYFTYCLMYCSQNWALLDTLRIRQSNRNMGHIILYSTESNLLVGHSTTIRLYEHILMADCVKKFASLISRTKCLYARPEYRKALFSSAWKISGSPSCCCCSK